MEVIYQSPLKVLFSCLLYINYRETKIRGLKKTAPHHQLKYIPPNIWNFYIFGILLLQSNDSNGKLKSVKGKNQKDYAVVYL